MSKQEELNSQELGTNDSEVKVSEVKNCEVIETQSPVSNEISENQVESNDANESIVDYNEFTEGQLVEEAKGLMKSNPDSYSALKSQMDAIKRAFYKKWNAKKEELRNAYFENKDESGEESESYVEPTNPLEEELQEILNKYKEKRASEIQRAEEEKQNNLAAKNALLDELKALLDSPEDFGKKVPQFQKLQQDWKNIGQVPATEVNTLWKTYQLYVENFYDSLKINNELREYDFRKNLEQKEALCEQAEALAEEKDILGASRKLQELHDQWREIGPVSRENRESIWTRFKDASTVVNKKHHDYFEKLRANELENLAKKTALCEKLESIDLTAFNGHKEWQDKSEEIIAIQEEWKTIGFAPKKDNVAIYERFRTACDNFFKAKNAFFKNTKEQYVTNLNKKIALCEKAESLKDSTDWKKSSEIFVQLQKEWKEIGAVPRKQSDAIWSRFVKACDYFFEQKNLQAKSARTEQEDNLKKKEELIVKINALEITKDTNKAYSELKSLIAEWNEIGHVPFKEKDKVYKAYKTAIDAKFDQLNVDQANRRMDAYKSNLQDIAEKGQQKLQSEKKRLMRQYDAICGEIATSENNIGFFKSSPGMLKELQLKIEKLKKEKSLLVEKIKMLEETAK